MGKRALCVGINDYPLEGNDLEGCVNDANAWATLLVDHYDFARSDVHMLTDGQATHAAIIAGLKKLLKGAKAGDVLVFTNSSHGTYIADRDGDEALYDEAICPWDIREHPLVDDELRALFAGVAKGVHLTVISDSCFSGTVTRLYDPDALPSRPRFLSPKAIDRPVIDTRAAKPRQGGLTQAEMHEVLLSGCSDEQTSSDVSFPEGAYGAMSYYALQTIAAAKYKLTYSDLHKRVLAALKKNRFEQRPQLEGASANKGRQIFT
jgi:hypothetical protein